MSADQDLERFGFQAEVVQILDLMIHSLYSNKEIFLRELISNASDAIDRLRIEKLSNQELPEDDGPLQIVVSYDTEASTVSISDNGIGMSLARGHRQPRHHRQVGHPRVPEGADRRREQGCEPDRGVRRRLLLGLHRGRPGDGDDPASRLAADEAVHWESDAKGEYTIQPTELPHPGTTVVLHLRDDDKDLLNGHRLRTIIAKYSDHISVPILMPAEAGPTDEPAGEEADKDEDNKAAEYTTVNQASALWTRPQSEISEADYHEFYRHISNDYSDPLAYVHRKIEGRYEYTLLLFIPAHAPYDLWLARSRHGIRLHVRRVFIMEDDGQLMPSYLRFVRGVLDSADLPLNVSRELLQSSQLVASIQSQAVKTVLRLLKDMAENEATKYATFWSAFGTLLKEGIVDDYSNRDAIARLLRFSSTASSGTDQDVSLPDYVGRMKEGQDKIYYLLAPTSQLAASSPHLEIFRKKGIEVLLLGEEIDNWLVNSLTDFDEKRLQSVAHSEADLSALGDDEADAEAREKANSDFAALTDKLKEALDGKAFEVRVSSRLTESPACIVAGGPDFSFALGPRTGGPTVPAQPVLEVNPAHPLVQRLNANPDDPHFADWANVLFNQAVLTLGARIDDPAGFVTQLNELLVSLAQDESG